VTLPSVSQNLDRAAAWTWRALVCAAALALVLAVIWYLRVITLPIAVALTIAPTLSPVASWFRRRRHLARWAAGLALLTGLAVIALLVAIVAVSVVDQFDELVDSVAGAVDDITAELEGSRFDLTLADDLKSTLEDSWRQASSYAASGVHAGAGVVTGVALSIAMLYAVLQDGGDMWASILRRFPSDTRPAVDRAGRRAWDALGGFVRATAQVATIDAVLIGLGLWLLGVPLAFALAVLVFMGSFVPYIGSFASGLVAVLVGFADGGWELALAVLALVIAVQFIEGTFLQPIIQSRSVHLHPAVVLLAVTAGGSLFGIAGAFLAVPVVAVVSAIHSSLAAEDTVAEDTASASNRPSARQRLPGRAALGWQGPRRRSLESHETKETQ
jgi:predicted PurR-regulated permease PerM